MRPEGNRGEARLLFQVFFRGKRQLSSVNPERFFEIEFSPPELLALLDVITHPTEAHLIASHPNVTHEVRAQIVAVYGLSGLVDHTAPTGALP